MNYKKITFRIDQKSRLLLESKSQLLGLGLSTLIRKLLEITSVLSLTELNQSQQHTKDKLDHKFCIKISIDKYLLLEEFIIKKRINLSQLMRLIIYQDNTKIADEQQVNECLNLIYPLGVLINQIAYQLNIDNIKSMIGHESYTVATSRLQMVLRNADNIINLIKYSDSLNNSVVTLHPKINIRAWLAQTYPIKNNLNQIYLRLQDDHFKKIVSDSMFREISEKLEVCNKKLQTIISSVKIKVRDVN